MQSTYWLALAICAGAARAQAQPAPQKFDKLGLTVTFPAAFADLHASAEPDEGVTAEWSAKFGMKALSIFLIEAPEPDFDEPSDVTDRILTNFREDEDEPDPRFQFDECKLVAGPFGRAPYASFARHAIREPGATASTGTEFYFCGVLKDRRGYMFDLSVEPEADAGEARAVLDFFTKGVVYAGEQRDPKWTDEEVRARWNRDVPKADQKSRQLEKTIRTEHYIVLTNSSSGALFAKKMEDCYATIKKTFPFDEVPGRRLLPVFVFQMADEYYDFYAKQFEETLEEARKSKGVASGDFYSTWYESPNDPVHIHEATHQIFANRLMLGGGGSWFQEGVAEYICTKPTERNDIARMVKNGKHVPLVEFIRLESLIDATDEDDKSGADAASNGYAQAALLIEFLRDGKLGKDRFPAWMHAIGLAPDNDRAAIESITRASYGLDLAELDKALVEYCKKR